MKKAFAFFTLFFFIFLNGPVLAKQPKGLEKKDKIPKGFSQGEKKGWDGEYPNGWDKMTREEKKQWLREQDQGLEAGEYEADDPETLMDEGRKKHKKAKKKKNKK